MAQTGYTPIQLYYSTTAATAPLAANLANGELAINITDGKLFYKDNAAAVQVIGWKTVPATAGGTGLTSYAVGDILYANTTTTLAKLADVATGNALISGGVGVAPSYGKIGLTTHVSGTLPVANGGTNLTSFTANGLVYASSTSALATGSAITFDGTNFATTGTASAAKLIPTGSSVTGNGLYLPATNALGLSTNGANAIYINSGQDVGIGTALPSAKLHISGVLPSITNGNGQLQVFSNDAIAANKGGKISLGGVSGQGGAFDPYGFCYVAGLKENATASDFSGYLAFGTSTSGGTVTERQRISSAGIVTMSAYGAGAATFSAAGVISSVSDETWKIKDGVPVNADSMLMKLEPGYWYYNDEKKEIFGTERQLGFYAQNVNAAIGPEAAPVPETTIEIANDGSEISTTKPWGYYDRSVLAVVVISLQKALVTIESLTERIKALESR